MFAGGTGPGPEGSRLTPDDRRSRGFGEERPDRTAFRSDGSTRGVPTIKVIVMKGFAILWDLDGTLIDTTELRVRSFIYALERIGYPIKPEHAFEVRKRLGMKYEDIMREVFPDLSKEEVEEVRRIRREFMLSNIEFIKPLPASKLLRELSDYPNALVTSSNRYFVEKIVEMFGWKFDVIITADDVRKGKPNPEPILLALKRLNVSDGVMIGDSEFDRISAEKAGIRFLHVKDIDKIWEILRQTK